MGFCLISMTMNDLLPSPICLRESNLRGLANNAKYDTISLVNAKYDTISSVKHGAKPLVVVMSRIVRAVCRPPYFVVF